MFKLLTSRVVTVPLLVAAILAALIHFATASPDRSRGVLINAARPAPLRVGREYRGLSAEEFEFHQLGRIRDILDPYQ